MKKSPTTEPKYDNYLSVSRSVADILKKLWRAAEDISVDSPTYRGCRLYYLLENMKTE